MNSKDRVTSFLSQNHEGVLVSFWRHFYESEFELETYVASMLKFYEAFEWDFLKLNPRSSYHNEVWGVRYEPSHHPLEKPRMTMTPIQGIQDWDKVIVRKGPDHPVFAEQLEAIRRIRNELGPDVFLLQTIFSPLEVTSRFLPEKRDLAAFLRLSPDLFRHVLSIVTDTLKNFALEALRVGANGIFFATTWATRDVSDSIFEVFERVYDLEFLNAVRPHCDMILLHVCGTQVRVEEMLDYPVDAFHWNWMDEKNPHFLCVEQKVDKPIVGGLLGNGILKYGKAERLYDYIERAVRPKRWIVSAECTIPPDTPEENLWIIRKAIATLRKESWPAGVSE